MINPGHTSTSGSRHRLANVALTRLAVLLLPSLVLVPVATTSAPATARFPGRRWFPPSIPIFSIWAGGGAWAGP
jgi:hypothetical protein